MNFNFWKISQFGKSKKIQGQPIGAKTQKIALAKLGGWCTRVPLPDQMENCGISATSRAKGGGTRRKRGYTRAREKGREKKESTKKGRIARTCMPCHPFPGPAWRLTACWNDATEDCQRMCTSLQPGRGPRPGPTQTPEAFVCFFFSLPFPRFLPGCVNCDTCMLSFRAILPRIWHTMGM